MNKIWVLLITVLLIAATTDAVPVIPDRGMVSGPGLNTPLSSHGDGMIGQNQPNHAGASYLPGMNLRMSDPGNRVIVKYKNSPIKNQPSSLNAIMQSTNEQMGTEVVRDMQEFGLSGMQVVQAPAATSVTDLVSEYKQNSNVEYAEPDYIISLYPSQIEDISDMGNLSSGVTNASSAYPDDRYFADQWGLRNTGQAPFTGKSGSDIDIEDAWKITTGSPTVTVAVIDTGVDTTHPDLAPNIWNNTKEIAGNGIDDDGDGYIDDINGWNFVGKNGSVMDDNGHGTHCAGIIGAVGNNQIGVAGIGWKTKIMPLKFMNSTGNGYLSDAISALLYANKMGADVISCSWAGPETSASFKDAIEASSAVVVCAAGNEQADDDTTPTYPASYNSPNLITVAASDQNDTLASFSNYGAKTVHIAAPGVKIASTYPGNSYKYMTGTSMATPFVAGVAALLKASDPTLTNVQIKERILSSADSISSLSGKVSSGGRLNAYRALTGAQNRQETAGEESLVAPVQTVQPTFVPTAAPSGISAGMTGSTPVSSPIFTLLSG